jgi:hypothetical protein
MTTLRELILTRARQRHDLLKLLFEFSYYERIDIREHVRKSSYKIIISFIVSYDFYLERSNSERAF